MDDVATCVLWIPPVPSNSRPVCTAGRTLVTGQVFTYSEEICLNNQMLQDLQIVMTLINAAQHTAENQ